MKGKGIAKIGKGLREERENERKRGREGGKGGKGDCSHNQQ